MKNSNVIIIALSFALLSSCSKSLLIDNDQLALKQYADGIIDFSTEYTIAPGPWSSAMLLGSPDTYPEYGDIQTSWAPKNRSMEAEFLMLAFDTAQYVNMVEIFETYNPGSIVSVSLRNKENGSWTPVYQELVEKNLPKKARIKQIDFPMTTYLVDAVKIILATRKIEGWNEIDAVSISGMYEND